MLACWKRDPEERLTFTKALQWLKGKHEEAPRQKGKTIFPMLASYFELKRFYIAFGYLLLVVSALICLILMIYWIALE